MQIEVRVDAAVALEIVSENPIGVGVGHGWEPATDTYGFARQSGGQVRIYF